MNRLSRLFQSFTKPINLLSILRILAIWSKQTHGTHPRLLIAGALAEIIYLSAYQLFNYKIELSISHTRRDAEFVFELSRLLQKACNIPAEKLALRAFDKENHVLHLDAEGIPKGLNSCIAYIGVHTRIQKIRRIRKCQYRTLSCIHILILLLLTQRPLTPNSGGIFARTKQDSLRIGSQI